MNLSQIYMIIKSQAEQRRQINLQQQAYNIKRRKKTKLEVEKAPFSFRMTLSRSKQVNSQRKLLEKAQYEGKYEDNPKMAHFPIQILNYFLYPLNAQDQKSFHDYRQMKTEANKQVDKLIGILYAPLFFKILLKTILLQSINMYKPKLEKRRKYAELSKINPTMTFYQLRPAVSNYDISNSQRMIKRDIEKIQKPIASTTQMIKIQEWEYPKQRQMAGQYKVQKMVSFQCQTKTEQFNSLDILTQMYN